MIKEKASEKEGSVNRQTLYYRQNIDNIKADTVKLKDEMSIGTINQVPIGTESYIARLQDQEDAYRNRIKLEKTKRKDLDRKIAEVQKKILEKKQALAMPKDKQIKETNETITLKIKKTEHKLEKILQKYNEVLARNKHLRDEINGLRKEKKTSEEILKNLEKEYKACEKEEVKMQKESNRLKEIGLNLKKQLEDVKNKKKVCEQEMERFNKDWQEVDKLMDQAIRTEDSFSRDGTVRTPISEQKELTGPEALENTTEEIEKYSIRDAVNKVQMFAEAFKKIEEATGISDVEGLMKVFIEAEERNYSLFSHVNVLTNDIQRLDDQILDMNNEIQKYNKAGIITAAQREKVLKDLEVKLNLTELRADMFEKRYEKTMRTIMTFKYGIQQLLDKIGASDLITEDGVDESNIMQYLGVIELRTNEILQMFRYCQNSNSESPAESVENEIIEKKPLKIFAPIIIEKEKETEDDESSRILNRQEYLEKAQVRMQEFRK